jgi:hypothetical protein
VFLWCVLVLALAAAPALLADSRRPAGLKGFYNNPDSFWGFESHVELGFLGFFSNKIQFGATGTYFDYVKYGGLDVWFPFQRISADVYLGAHNRLVFLYQPIDVRTEVRLSTPSDISEYGATFYTGLPLRLRYGFDFYRVSYLYDFLASPRNELAVGASLQIRDAVITFAQEGNPAPSSPTAPAIVSEGNVGPVPALKLRARYYVSPRVWLGAEVDGIYAAGKGFVGSTTVNSGFVGAIIDASLRAGITPREYVDAFLNLRYLAGGAEGTQTDAVPPSDGYTKNWLQAFSVSLGVTLR